MNHVTAAQRMKNDLLKQAGLTPIYRVKMADELLADVPVNGFSILSVLPRKPGVPRGTPLPNTCSFTYRGKTTHMGVVLSFAYVNNTFRFFRVEGPGYDRPVCVPEEDITLIDIPVDFGDMPRSVAP